MGFLRLIDSEDVDAGQFSYGPEIITHTASDRGEARRILAYDLKNTADPKWSAEILAQFDAGKNSITMPNGIGHSFSVEYIP